MTSSSSSENEARIFGARLALLAIASAMILVVIVVDVPRTGASPSYYELQQLLARKRLWPSQIKNCIASCKRVLYKCHKDMNYCIEGCRIRVYKPIYYCVNEQCNNRGIGVNETLHPVKYHQCVHLCKLRPKKNATKGGAIGSAASRIRTFGQSDHSIIRLND